MFAGRPAPTRAPVALRSSSRPAFLQRPTVVARAAASDPVLADAPVPVSDPEAVMASSDQAKAILRFHRGSPSKVRRVLDAIRGRTYEDALKILTYLPHRCASRRRSLFAREHAGLSGLYRLQQSQCLPGEARMRCSPFRTGGRASLCSLSASKQLLSTYSARFMTKSSNVLGDVIYATSNGVLRSPREQAPTRVATSRWSSWLHVSRIEVASRVNEPALYLRAPSSVALAAQEGCSSTCLHNQGHNSLCPVEKYRFRCADWSWCLACVKMGSLPQRICMCKPCS
jgi:ribosomal protein L22